MTRHLRSTRLLRPCHALLALLVCALASLMPAHAFGEALRPPSPGHHLKGDFLRFWNQNDGARNLGPPLSAPIWLDGRVVQLFARAYLEQAAGQATAVASAGLPEGWQQ